MQGNINNSNAARRQLYGAGEGPIRCLLIVEHSRNKEHTILRSLDLGLSVGRIAYRPRRVQRFFLVTPTRSLNIETMFGHFQGCRPV